MKIIHTSDWHLGQTFHDYDRSIEQEDMLMQMVDIVRDERPDAMLVSGDVFHIGSPAPRAIELYNRALLTMLQACPTMQIVVAGGNHDSATRLMVNNDLWEHFRVKVIGNVARKKGKGCKEPDFDRHIVTVVGADGYPKGYIAAVPHCYEQNFPSILDLAKEEKAKAYFQGLLDRVAEINEKHLPVVLMAHMAVEGCDTAGHDNIGGIVTREVSIFGSGYDYIALGHIHTPHNINNRVRYCGSPIPVNFGEKGEHSISLVTLETGVEPKVELRLIHNKVPLLDFPTEPMSFSEVREMIKSFPSDEVCYMRVLIKKDDTMTPLATTLLNEAVKDKKCRICKVQVISEKKYKRADKEETSMTSNELRTKTPVEIAEMFFAMIGQTITEKQRQMIGEATIKAEQIKKGDIHEI